MDNLQKEATPALEQNPTFKGKLKKAEIAGHSYLTLSLDGNMIPWDNLPIEDLKESAGKAGDADKVIERLKKMTLVVALGLRGEYLLLSIGSSTDALERLGQGKPLADRPEMSPLKKFADKRVTAVGYVESALSTRLFSNRKDFDDLLKATKQLLPQTGLPAAEQEQIAKDAAALAADLKTLAPDPGALAYIGFRTDRGAESYQYWTGHFPLLDGSKPLSLLEHIGGNPTIAAVLRGKVSGKNYEMAAKWLGVGYGYFEKYGLPRMPEQEREKFQKFATAARPLVEQLHKTTRDMLLPALADGQFAFVIDTKLKSKQFLKSLPATEKSMPMLEPALVFGVSDANLLRKACVEYRTIGNGLIDAIRKIEGTQVPEDFSIPEPTILQESVGTLYTFPLPKEAGVNEKAILLNAGLSSSVAVLSVNKGHTKRLLGVNPPSIQGRPVDVSRALAATSMIDVAGLVDVLTPWIDLGVNAMIQNQPGGDDPAQKGQVAMYLDQVHTVLDVLKVVRAITGQTYTEGDTTVHHMEIELHDVEE